MKEKYDKIYEIDKNLYLDESPVVIAAGTLLVDKELDQKLVQLKFLNTQKEEIKEIEVELALYDGANRKLKEVVTHRYLDLSFKMGEYACQKNAIELNEKTLSGKSIGKYDVKVKEVVYKNKKVWKNKELKPYKMLEEANKLNLNEKLDEDCIDEFYDEYGENCIYVPKKLNNLWYCTCGNINSVDNQKCTACERNIDFIKDIDFKKKNKEYKNNIELKSKKETENFFKLSALLLIGFVVCILFSLQKTEFEFEYSDYSNLAQFSIGGNTFLVELYPDIAPITVDNFKKLVDSNFYDGLTLHRIEKDFVIQGGDPAGNGTGGSDINIKGEFAENGVTNDLKHEIGVISMARSSEYDSASSQFFICTGDCSFLDGSYAAFGEVVEGLEVVMALNELELEDGTSTPINVDEATIDYIKLID